MTTAPRGHCGRAAWICLLPLLCGAGAEPGVRGTIRGYYNGGDPMQGVKVELLVDGQLVQTTESNEQGTYVFTGVPDGRLELVHSRSGLATVSVAPGDYVYPDSYSVRVVMHPATGYGHSFDVAPRLVVTVLDAATGEPLAGRRVRLHSWGEFETDRLGRFTIFEFPYGEHALEFETEGYRDRIVYQDVQDIYQRLVVRLEPQR